MEIKTKFNRLDKVFYLEDDTPKTGRISSIDITITPDGINISYEINGRYFLLENKIFATADQVIAYIKEKQSQQLKKVIKELNNVVGLE